MKCLLALILRLSHGQPTSMTKKIIAYVGGELVERPISDVLCKKDPIPTCFDG